jgi:hypothetical protein
MLEDPGVRGERDGPVTQQSGSWPPGGQPATMTGSPPPVAAPKPHEAWTPERVEPVAGTEFALVQLKVVPLTSGLATGSLIAGVAAVLVSTLVLCFGLYGQSAGWGAVVAGAFALLGVLVGGGSVGLGLAARRQIRRSGQDGRVRFVGGGLAKAGISCGAAGLGIAVLTLLLVVVLQVS